MSKIDINKIFEATNDGLDIIEFYYPDARPKRNFKIRPNEKTASASLWKNPADGHWIVTDFGGDNKRRNAIAIVELEEGLEYGEALRFIADKYNIPYDDGSKVKIGPDVRKYPKKEGVEDGKEFFYKDSLSKFELRTLGKFVTNETCNNYNLKAVDYYLSHKGNETTEIRSTDYFPIFVLERGKYRKIMQPLSKDKKWRFFYDGEKPKDADGRTTKLMWGFEYVQKKYDLLNTTEEKPDDNGDNENAERKPKKLKKLDEVVICSGDRDALNMASLGFPVVWMNSETQLLTKKQYNELKGVAKVICNVPDIDTTGVIQGKKLAQKFINIRTFWLPKWLMKEKDQRGNPCKDFRDFVSKSRLNLTDFRTEVKGLLRISKPLQFWDKVPNSRSGGYRYVFRHEYALSFLQQNGFFRYEKNNGEIIYVKKTGNIIKAITDDKISDVKNFALEWVRDLRLEIEVCDMIHSNKQQFTDANLNSLPFAKPSFEDSDETTQLFNFRNESWVITKDKIETIDLSQTNKMVWEHKIIDQDVTIEPDYFKISKKDGELDIEILKTDNEVLNFLINTSRVHWRKELEDQFKGQNEELKNAYHEKNRFNIAGEYLDEFEVLEQKQHLINKIYSIGYLLHSYKASSNAMAVFAMDDKLSESGKSFGRSGKSLLYNVIVAKMIPRHFTNGNAKVLNGEFKWHGVSEDQKIVVLEDCYKGFTIRDHLFTEITTDWHVNPKNGSPYTIPFSNSPKPVITSNFTPVDTDSSTMRRLLITVFSDYYHIISQESDYSETRKVTDDFDGVEFFSSRWTDKQMNSFINFMVQCLKFYLGHKEKIEAPIGNVMKRNLQDIMGDEFKAWADEYMSDKLNQFVPKHQLLEDHKRDHDSKHKISSITLTKKMKNWCKFYGHIYNPADVSDKDGRISKHCPELKTTVKYFFIRTVGEHVQFIKNESNELPIK
ncbi:MAG: primase-helicase family protein [Flavobacteriales bacterium]